MNHVGKGQAGRSAIVDVVAEEVARVLSLPSVGPQDDLYVLGLRSLQSVVLVARLADRGIEVPLHDMLDCGTVTELTAAVVGDNGAKRGDRSDPQT